MRSAKPGTNILEVEVTHITPRGIWLYAKGKEYFLSYANFPWFKAAKLSQIHDVVLNRERYLHWRGLDVDLEIESLEHINYYPLTYR